MPLDRCRSLKLESPAENGTQSDLNPTEITPSQDALDAAGFYVQSPTGGSLGDTKVLYGRSGDQAAITDPTAGQVLLANVVTNTSNAAASHNALLDIIHFLADGGPGDGFASGAVKVDSFVAGTALVSTSIWYTSATLTVKLYAVTYTYTGPLVSQQAMVLYNAAGTAVRTVKDVYTYTGPVITQTVRSWA